jgi:hypothetical protein
MFESNVSGSSIEDGSSCYEFVIVVSGDPRPRGRQGKNSLERHNTYAKLSEVVRNLRLPCSKLERKLQ